MLARGEQKSLQTDRVILVPGPEEEVEIVRRIYQQFVEDGRPRAEIADGLNAAGILTDLGRPWTRGTVHQVLTNEKYIGNNVYNRISFKLKKHRVINPPEMWVRADGAFEAVVEPTLFYTAQGIIRERSRRYSDAAAYFGVFGGRFRSNPAGDFAAKRHPLAKGSRCPPRRIAADEVILSCRVY